MGRAIVDECDRHLHRQLALARPGPERRRDERLRLDDQLTQTAFGQAKRDLLSLVALLFTLALHAAPHDITVTWRGVEGCEQRGFTDSLDGYLAGGTRQRTVAVRITVERVAAAQWAATLELSTGDTTGTRRLTGSSCAELSSAAAFITAVLVDPGDMRTRMHQEAFPGEDISDRPLPETVVPAFLRLLKNRPPSGRSRLAEQAVAA